MLLDPSLSGVLVSVRPDKAIYRNIIIATQGNYQTMGDATEQDSADDFPPSFEEMRDHLGEARRNILTLLFAADNRAMNTSELRERSNVPSGSIRHHTDRLENWELIEEIDRVYTGRGARAIVWKLTDRGEEFCADGLDVSASSLVRPENFEEVQEEVTELRDDVENIKEAMVHIAVEAGGVREETAQDWLNK